MLLFLTNLLCISQHAPGNENVLDMAKICPLRHEGKVMRIVLLKKRKWKENDSCHRHFAVSKTSVLYINGKSWLHFFIEHKVCSLSFSLKIKLWGLLLNKMFCVLYLLIASI